MKNDVQNGQGDITLHDVMAHQQYHFQEMRTNFIDVHKRLNILEKDMKEVKVNMEQLNRRTYLTDTKIDNICDRLDDIEFIPFITKETRRHRQF